MPRRIRFHACLLAAAIALAAPGQALAAQDHAHGGSPAQLTLDPHGKKWPTDEPLRQGMSQIRADMAASLSSIHAGKLAAADYAKLAAAIEANVKQIVAGCKLPPEADAQLHIVLAELLDGAEGMKKASAAGAGEVVKALASYESHFDHPGWKPLMH